MKLEHSFEVEAPLERVWETLIDVERVAPCLPGAEITGSSEGVYEGNFTVKLGPTTAAYAGKLELTEVDEAAHRVTMSANGRDKRGQGSAKATIVSSMSQDGETTRVEVATDFTLTGRLARFGRGGLIEDVSNRLVGDFVDCLRSSIERAPEVETAADGSQAARPQPAQPAKPVHGIRIFLAVLWGRLKRLGR
jgi:carbon monoxide dehydrogenase subunit G